MGWVGRRTNNNNQNNNNEKQRRLCVFHHRCFAAGVWAHSFAPRKHERNRSEEGVHNVRCPYLSTTLPATATIIQ